MTVIVTLCEVCEKPTLEPIYHLTEGDAYCGSCVASLLTAEIEVYRRALRDAGRPADRRMTAAPEPTAFDESGPS